eukprot:TRINITY_DN9744_c0_g1_i4.p1 TRINITY_DN9744_c0_g1~~TRINITY_DN9744_c0_g1_i4.p1  ORF type:complete len:436 (+),score=80.49 TRINITY_DN9744_c0_g1_i4:35-1342(+)
MVLRAKKFLPNFDRYVQYSLPSITTKTHFNHLKLPHFREFSGGRLLLSTHHSTFQLLSSAYPHFHWNPFDFDKLPNLYLHHSLNQLFSLEFFSRMAPELILRQEDWKTHHGIISDFPGIKGKEVSISDFLIWTLPEFNWGRWNFFPSLRSVERRRVFVDEMLLSGFEFVSGEGDLSDISCGDILGNPGTSYLVALYGGSVQVMFSRLYPELPLLGEKTDGYWKNRMAIDRFLLEHFGFVQCEEDITEITGRRLLDHPAGATLLVSNKGSPISIFQTVYVELSFKNSKTYHGYWNNLESNYLIQNTMRRYHLKRKEDWYKLSIFQLSEVNGKEVSRRKMISLLEFWVPEVEWDYQKFKEKLSKRANQRFLGLKLRELFYNEVILEEFQMKDAQQFHVFDFCVPGRKLMIEYQGQQHYYNIFQINHRSKSLFLIHVF